MAKTEIEIKGIQRVKQKLENIKKQTNRNIKKALYEAGGIVQRDAKMRVYNGHSRTGELAGSIHVKFLTETTVKIYTASDHASYHEFGTGRRGQATHTPPPKANISFTKEWAGRPAYPFLYPALLANKERTRRIISRALEQ